MPKRDKFDLEYAVAVGRGVFPMDMLRYDRCSPFDSTDAAALHSGCESCLKDENVGDRVVILVRHIGSPAPFTPDRWATFNWPIQICGVSHTGESAARSYAKSLRESFAKAQKKA